MKTQKTHTKCRTIRGRLYEVLANRISVNCNWVQEHIAGCPKCRRRLASLGRVTLAFSVLRSHRHNVDLLMRANAQAIGVLGRSLRDCAKANKLKKALPQPTLLEKAGKYRSPAVNAAACLAILVLMKTGVFSSFDKFQSEGQKLVQGYYTSRAGEDLAGEMFSA